MKEKDLAKKELIGLNVKIKDCKDPRWNEVSGKIVDETKHMFTIKINKQQKKIAKNIAKFQFKINGKKIIIDGSKIMYRPEDRIKKIR